VSLLSAQFGPPLIIQGEVENQDADTLVVEAISTSGHRSISQALTRRDGRFSLGPLEPGSYEIRVKTEMDQLPRSDWVEVHSAMPPLSIRLPAANRPQRPVSGLVSFRDLTKERRTAARLLIEARDLPRRSKLEDAFRKIEKSVRQDPSFAAAHHELAIQLLILKRPWDARNELLLTINLDPKFQAAYTNLAVADLEMGNSIGAEQAAARSLEIKPGDPRAQYLRDLSRWLQQRGPKPAPYTNIRFGEFGRCCASVAAE